MPWYSPGGTLAIQNSQEKMPTPLRQALYCSDSAPSDYISSYPSYRRTYYSDSSYSSRSPTTTPHRYTSISDEPLSSSTSRDRSETRDSSYTSYTINRSRDLSKSRLSSKSSDLLKSPSSSLTRKHSGTAASSDSDLWSRSSSSYMPGAAKSSLPSKFVFRPPRSYSTTSSRISSISSSPTWEKRSLTTSSLLSPKTPLEVKDANLNSLSEINTDDSNSNKALRVEKYIKINNSQNSGENHPKDVDSKEVTPERCESETIEVADTELADKINNVNIKVTVLEDVAANGKTQDIECDELATNPLQEKNDLAENSINGTSAGIKTRTVQSQEGKGLVGLKNIGNTCFLNSVVQCLSNTRLLMEYITSQQYLNDIRSDTKGSLMKAFGDLIQNIWQSSSSCALNTGSFKNQVQRYAPRFDGYLQHDAQEFLRYLLEGLHEDINRVTTKQKMVLPDISDDLTDNQKAQESWKRYLRIDNSKIVDIFVGQLKSTLQCTTCKHCSTTFEAFWDLSLSLPKTSGKISLSQCLELFTSEEILDGDEMPTCSKCKCRRKCKKRFLIHKFPQVLVLHLKRFSPSERYRKISVAVDFPVNALDMSQYAAQSHTKAEYNLYAVANHNGTASSGHYTAYCKHPQTAQWHQYNDTWVTPQSVNDLVSASGYVLFYEQISSTRL